MAQPTFRIDNLDKAIAAFEGAAHIIETEVAVAVERINTAAAERLSNEPPELSGQRYVRTHRLSGEWQNQKPRFVVSGSSKRSVLRNETPYARWVQSRDDQAKVHQGRWPTVEDVQEELAPMAEEELHAAGVRAMNRIAGAL